jgi:hypothetical protein
MPYISKERISALWNDSITDRNSNVETAGELNYWLTDTIVTYLTHKGLTYQTCNDIVGALDNAKSEFVRRVQIPYEDKKIKENGDVYPKQFLKGGK